MNFEEIINFAEFWALSCLKWNDLKTGEGLVILKKRYFKNINETLDSKCIICGPFYAYLWMWMSCLGLNELFSAEEVGNVNWITLFIGG